MFVEFEKEYAYLFGLYLSDGHISKFPRTHRMRISFHSEKNQRQMVLAAHTIGLLFPNNSICYTKKKNANCIDLIFYNSLLCEIFPQHGPGAKHLRDLQLEKWQKRIVTNHSSHFMKGLFDGDGSRYLVSSKNEWKYSFTNKSKDILTFMKECLDCHEIKYCETFPKAKKGTGHILIQSRAGVKKLDELLAGCTFSSA